MSRVSYRMDSENYRCGSGHCGNPGTAHCQRCRSIWYCGKDCQKTHWQKHKLVCRPYEPLRPGIFNFLGLPKELRDKIYEEALVARFAPAQQREYDALLASNPKDHPNFSRRNGMNALEEYLLVNPGWSHRTQGGFEPLASARGLMFANKQIYEEAIATLFSKNIFSVTNSEEWRLNTPNHMFSEEINKTHMAKIQHLNIGIMSETPHDHHDYQKAVAILKHNMFHIVRDINSAKMNLKSLKVRYFSMYGGEAELMQREIDALLTHPRARPVRIERLNGTNDVLFGADAKRFHVSGFDIGAALEKLNVPVERFRIFGDLPGAVVASVTKKFATAAARAEEEDRKAFKIPAPPAPDPTPLNPTTGQPHNASDFIVDYARRNPHDKSAQKMAREAAHMTIKSPKIMRMLMAPPTREEMERMGRSRAR